LSVSSSPTQTLHTARRVAAAGLPGAQPIRVPEVVADAVVGHLANQRLTGVAIEGLRSGAVVLPDGARAALSDAHLRASVLVVALERRLGQVVRALLEEDVEPVVLKGPTLARPFYGSIVRTYGDIDLLVPVAGWRRALDVLARSGFRRLIPEPRPGFDERFGKGASHADPEGYEVDLHRTLVLGPFGLWIDPDELLSRAVPFSWHDRTFRRLDDTATLLHVCLHASLGSRPPLLLPLRDVLQVAYTGTVDWGAFAELSRRWRIGAPVSWALRSAAETLGVPLPPAAAALELGAPGLVERWALRAYVTDRRGTGGIELGTLVGLDGIRDRIAYARALLFPDEEFRATRGTPRRTARWKRPAAWARDAARRRVHRTP
jgi:hypothetical protein